MASEDQLVSGVWLGRPRRGALVPPDGRIDVVWTPHDEPVLVGAHTAPSPVDFDLSDSEHMIGVQLRIGAAASVFAINATDVTDKTVPLSGLLGSRTLRRITDPLADGVDPWRRAHGLARALAELGRSRPAPDQMVQAMIAGIVNPAHIEPLELSDRQRRRRFQRCVGYGPAFFARVVRFQTFLTTASKNDWPLAQLAATCGYADESHLARDCRALAGTTPSDLRRRDVHFVQSVGAASP